MPCHFINRWIRSCILLIFLLNSLTSLYSQVSQPNRELNEAIENVENAQYEIAIPVLKKYAEIRELDDYKKFEITVYLNWCYFATKNDSFDIKKVNKVADDYFSKYGVSKIDSSKSRKEQTLLKISGFLNYSVENFNKMIFFYSLLKAYYDEKKGNFEKQPDYLLCLSYLGIGYSSLGDYSKALELHKELSETGKEVWGEKDPNYLACLNLLALDYSSLGDYKNTIKIYQNLCESGKEVWGEKDLKYLQIQNNMATAYLEIGDYQKASDIFINVLEVRKEILGEKHPDYLTSLNNLASVYSSMGYYKNALELSQEVIRIGKEVWGERNLNYITVLSNIALIYDDLGDYQKALETDLKVLELRKELLGDRHPDYSTTLLNIAAVYEHLGNYQKALEIFIEAVNLKKEILGEEHPDYLKSLSNLAVVYHDLGDYKKALEINLKVTELRKETLGDNHPDYLTSLNNLALVYSDLGNYQKALELNQEVAEMLKAAFGNKHPNYLKSLSNLAVVYHDLGDYKKALEINLKVTELRKETLGDNHPDYLTSLNNLALVYSDLGNYQKALKLNQEVAELRKEILGDEHPDYLTSLNNLATVYNDLGKNQEALEIHHKIVDIEKNVLSEKNPDYLISLSNLATDYYDFGDYQKAFDIDQKVAESFKEILGENHLDYINSLNDVALDEFRLLKFDSALFHKRIATKEIQQMIVRNFNFLTENQRDLFFKRYGSTLRYSTLIVENSQMNYPESVCFLFNFILFLKGLLLNTTIDFNELIAEKGTTEAIAKFEELKLLKLEIQRLSEKPIAERYLSVDSLENIAQQQETELVKISKEYGDYTGNLKMTWKDVQATLQDQDVAIEFVEYPTLTDTVEYAALVLRRGWQYPKFIPLFRKDQIEEFIKLDKNVIYSNHHVGKQIKNLIWSPLETVVSPGDRVYFSPAGIIHQLAIENLPVDDSTTLGDRYQMYRLSSTKELVVSKKQETSHTAVLYGGLIYSLEMPEMEVESKKYEFEKSSNYLAMRGYQNDTKDRNGWQFLKGTKPEVDQISRLMKDRNYQVTEYTGVTGNEESFKSLSGKKEGIIHIATHGFFLPIEESRKNPFMLQRMGDQQQERATVDPMLRSGLIMAGGNKAWLGEKIPENIEDGVLTAKEISHMDLRGTDLVVLSACETGLGEVSSEGVFGLQRSFKQAGVKTLVMSLWEVNDDATMYMMTEFYSNLLSGKEKREAFLEAKRKCKAKYSLPQYWAAFIMLD